MSLDLNSYAPGKLMLMGEFFVLRGSTCISVPSKFGQTIKVSEQPESNVLKWNANILGKHWFKAEYKIDNLDVIDTDNAFQAESFARLLKVTREINPTFLQIGASGKTNLTFPQSWGLGSSSTIVKLLSEWAKVDPFRIHFATSHGSGYDIASAFSSNPIMYKCTNEVPEFHKVVIPDIVKESCYFIFLGKKQNSQRSVKLFLQRGQKNLPVDKMNDMNLAFLNSKSVDEVCALMKEHDELLSPIVELKRVKEVMFSDFEGEVKSLGAWGGDFIMACTSKGRAYVNDYFSLKGLREIFSYNELLL